MKHDIWCEQLHIKECVYSAANIIYNEHELSVSCPTGKSSNSHKGKPAKAKLNTEKLEALKMLVRRFFPGTDDKEIVKFVGLRCQTVAKNFFVELLVRPNKIFRLQSRTLNCPGVTSLTPRFGFSQDSRIKVKIAI